MSLEAEMRQDVKEIRADVAQLRVDVALLIAAAENRKADSKLKISLFVAGLGFIGGILSSVVSSLLGG